MSDLIDRGDLLDALDELEEEWEDAGLNPSYYDAKRAIKNAKTVKEKVCEWKLEKNMFIQNPHTGRKFSNEPSMKNIYCNTCGRKIKIKGGE